MGFPASLRLFRSRSVFVRILAFFVLIILLTVILLGYISYEYTSSLLIREVMDSNLLLVRQVRNDVDKEIQSLDRTTFQLSLQAKVKAALYSSGADRGSDQVLYGDIIKDLNGILFSNPAICDLWIQLFPSDVVLSNAARYSKDFFFSQAHPYAPQVDWNAVTGAHPRLVSLGRHRVTGLSADQELLSFARSISVEDETPQGIACIDVDGSAFDGILNEAGRKGLTRTLVLDAAGDLVLQSRPQPGKDPDVMEGSDVPKAVFDSPEGYLRARLGHGEALVVFTTSEVNGWRYVSVVPTGIIMEKSGKIRQMTFAAALLCLALGVLISYLLARRLYHPIQDIMSYIDAFHLRRREGSGAAEENELAFINRILGTVYHENEALKDVFQKNVPVLREKLLYDALDGKLPEAEFREASARLSMELPFPRFIVVAFEKEDDASWGGAAGGGASIEQRLDEKAREAFQGTLRTFSLRKGPAHIVTVVNGTDPAAAAERLHEFLKETQGFFLRECGLQPTVGVGNVYDDPTGISRSLKEALSAARFKTVKGIGKITYIDEVKEIPEHVLEYSVATEQKIINAVKAGDEAGSLRIIEGVIRANLPPEGTSPEIVDNLFNALAATAVRTIYEIHSSVRDVLGSPGDIHRELLDRHEMDGKREYVTSVFASIGRYIRGRNQGQNQKIRSRISSFVQDNFAKDLSLTRVGEATGYSPAYLSSIFKELFHENFVDYVNRVRLEQAKRFLGRTELTVGQVSAMAGFASSNTFIKAFKKYEGVTPGQFREIGGN